MKLMQRTVLVLLALGLSACQTTGTITPLKYKEQKEVVRDGTPAILSDKKNIVSVSPMNDEVEDAGRASFLVLIANKTKKDFLISTRDISAKSLDRGNVAIDPGASEKGPLTDQLNLAFESAEDAKTYLAAYSEGSVTTKPLKVYSYEELKAEEESRATAEAIAIALGGFGRSMQAANAGYQNGYGSFNSYNAYGGPSYGTYSYSSYNPALAQAAQNAAQAQTELELSNASAQSRANMEYLNGAILKDHTLLPGETHGGIVEVQLPSFAGAKTSIPLLMTVEANGEEHNFLFKINRLAQN